MSLRITREAVSLPLMDTAPGYRRVSELIESEILSGNIKPGDLLPTEAELASQLGVHRSTVREGIRSLENDGLLSRAGGKRLVASIPDPTAIARYNARAMALRKVSFRELRDVQIRLEPYCAALAALRITDHGREALRESIERLDAGLDDRAAVTAHDISFHRLIARIAGNAALGIALDPIGELLLAASDELHARDPAIRRRFRDAHGAVAEAICARRQDDARDLMARHLQDLYDGYAAAGFELEEAIPVNIRTPR